MRHAPRDRGREHFGIVHRWVEESVCDTRQHPAIEHESLPEPLRHQRRGIRKLAGVDEGEHAQHKQGRCQVIASAS
jgi:hypothetical protein